MFQGRKGMVGAVVSPAAAAAGPPKLMGLTGFKIPLPMLDAAVKLQ